MLEEFRQEDADAMKAAEGALVRTLLPLKAHIHPMLLAIALVRCARTVLRLCEKEDQAQLLPLLVAFLNGKVNKPGDSVLWTPDQPRLH